MSDTVSVAATPYDGRGKAQQQQQRQHQARQPLLQQQQQQQHQRHQRHQPNFYRDRSAAGRVDAEGDGGQQQQYQNQQQRHRSRRPRSIHITLRKTRAGSRPVNIQRSQHPYGLNSGDRVGSPTTDPARSRDLPSSSAAYQLVDDATPPRATPPLSVQQQQQQQQQQHVRDPTSTTSSRSPGSLGDRSAPAFTSKPPSSTDPLQHSPQLVLEAPFVQGRGSRAGSTSDSVAAAVQHARVPSGGGVSGGAGGNASSSSSLNGLCSGGLGSNASVGPSSASGCIGGGGGGSGGGGLSQQSVPQLNTFMKAPHAALQQLLPPGMRERTGANSNGGSAHLHGGRGGEDAAGMSGDAQSPSQLVLQHPLQHQQQGVGYGPTGRLRSRSQLYISSSNMNLPSDPPAGLSGHRLRSNSSAAQYESLAGSYSGVLGDFVFPYPDKNMPLPPRTPPAAGDHVHTPVTAGIANAPTLSFESRSPRLSPPVVTGVHPDPLTTPETHQHTRARSYTAGGSYSYHNSNPPQQQQQHHLPLYHHRSSNTPVITASMAGVGGVALFTAHTHTPSLSHADSYASRNLDRSLSMSSTPAGLVTTVGVGVATSTSTMVHHNVNTSRSSLRSGTTRETTPVRVNISSPSTTPPAQQQQQRPTLTPSAAGTPAPPGSSTRKSESFVTRRSASLDVVNGLDDSVDSVLCGSTPRRRPSGHVTATHRYLTDSLASDSVGPQSNPREGNTPAPAPAPAAEVRRPRRYSTTLTDDEDLGAPAMSTIDRLRSRRDTNGSATSGGGSSHHSAAHRGTAAAGNSGGSSTRRPDHVDAAAEPKTAIERWRAQEEERRRRTVAAAAASSAAAAAAAANTSTSTIIARPVRHRLSARQWREAFRRLEENRLQWTLRSFIGSGTSGKVYEGTLDNEAHTPVAVKVLDVGVPMPMGGEGGEEVNMSPAQQEALLVLLREVEMMERLHQDNIVTCLRCQVTPVHDRFMELHHQQRRQQQQQRPSGGGGVVAGAETPGGGISPYRVQAANGGNGAAAAAAATVRVPVQVEIIMELCKRGTLAGVVRRSAGGQLPVIAARKYLRDVLKGLAYLHRNNFIHRDVKGENVLISSADVAKLADFGCSRRIVMTNSNLVSGTGEHLDGTMSSIATTHATDSRYTTLAGADYQWCEATGVAQTMVGTPMFMAPEIIQGSGAPPGSPSSVDSAERDGGDRDGEDGNAGGGGGGGGGLARSGGFGAAPSVGYTASADIWSFGCLILEVFGRTPWPAAGNNVYRLMRQIEQSVEAVPPGVPPDTPAELLSVLRCCFHRDPHRRSTARMLLRSPWMTCKDEELQEMPPRRRR